MPDFPSPSRGRQRRARWCTCSGTCCGSRRCRGSRTPWAAPTSIGSGRPWPTLCCATTASAWATMSGSSRSISMRPTILPHGQQEFALFNGYYDTWCYLSLLATMTFNTEPIQHAVAALPRPETGGRRPAAAGAGRCARILMKAEVLCPPAGHPRTTLVPGDQPAASAGHGIHTPVLRPRRPGEPAQRAAARRWPWTARAARGSPPPTGSCPSRPMSSSRCCRRGRAPPSSARRRSGPARAAGEDRGLGRPLGAAHRAALAPSLPLAGRGAPPGPGSDRHLTRRSAPRPLSPGRRLSPALRTRSWAQARPAVPGSAIAGWTSRPVVWARDVSTTCPLGPCWSFMRAFTNSPG